MGHGDQHHDNVDIKAQSRPAFDVPSESSQGSARALESLSGIAAPLLAAASVTVIGVIVQQPSSLAWPSLALTWLVLAAIALITSVQFGFWARHYAVTPAEIAAWWPMMDPKDRWNRVRGVQWHAAHHYRRWARYARIAYSAGIVALWMGVGFALVPSHASAYRWVPAALAWFAALAETVWSLAALSDPDRGRHLPGLRRITLWLVTPRYVIPPPETWPYDEHRDPFKP